MKKNAWAKHWNDIHIFLCYSFSFIDYPSFASPPSAGCHEHTGPLPTHIKKKLSPLNESSTGTEYIFRKPLFPSVLSVLSFTRLGTVLSSRYCTREAFSSSDKEIINHHFLSCYLFSFVHSPSHPPPKPSLQPDRHVANLSSQPSKKAHRNFPIRPAGSSLEF